MPHAGIINHGGIGESTTSHIIHPPSPRLRLRDCIRTKITRARAHTHTHTRTHAHTHTHHHHHHHIPLPHTTLPPGQSEFQWHLRTLPNVKRAFASVWGTDKLITSFDGANVFRPWSEHSDRKTRGGWYHVDQGKGKAGRKCCVQGLVTLTDATASTGGLVLLPGSHHDHVGVVARNGSFSFGDFIPLITQDPLLSRGPAALVCAKAGDLILWDSRTVHCNTPGLDNVVDGGVDDNSANRQDEHELVRMVGYVCMTPARWATYDVLARRRAAFAAKQTTSHWPHDFIPTGDGLVDGGGVTARHGILPCERVDRATALADAKPEVRALVDGGYGESWFADACTIS
jgi:hypothetical protein